MAIKKFVKLDGWDVLNDFYDKEVKGIHITIENFDRVFCKCGETHASEGGIVHKCPKCGNTDFIEYNSDGYYYYPVPEKTKYIDDDTLCPFVYKINRVRLYGEITDNRETISFKQEITPEIEFTETEVKIVGSTGRRRYGDSVPIDLIKKWPHFKDFEEILTEEGLEATSENLRKVCKKRKNYEEAISDSLYIQYPNLGKTVLNKILELEESKGHTIAHNKPFEYYLRYLNIDMSLLGIYDYYERKNKTSYYNIFSSYGYFSDSKSYYEKLQDYKKSKCIGYTIVERYIKNGMLDLSIALNLIKNLNEIYSKKPDFRNAPYEFRYRRNPEMFRKKFSDEDLDLLPVYIHENISLKSADRLPYDFIEDVITLRELKIPVTAENLKVKNLNYYLNKNRLAEVYKLPADKVECFIDWFEKNPLKAIQLVENRRKLTKKQLDAFIDEISAE